MWDIKEETMRVVNLLAQRSCRLIYAVIHKRFGPVPRDARRHFLKIIDPKTLTKLNVIAATCPDLETFRRAVLASPADLWWLRV
jgi:hypothetical protein